MRQLLCLSVILSGAAGLVCDAQTRHPGSRSVSLSDVERGKSHLLLSSEAVRIAIARAFELSGSGTLDVECGFGVTQNDDGGFETTAVTRGEAGIWRATLPASTVAIFHTHRNVVSARPSTQDILEADRLQRPIYVISNRGLWVYEPKANTGSKRPTSLRVAR